METTVLEQQFLKKCLKIKIIIETKKKEKEKRDFVQLCLPRPQLLAKGHAIHSHEFAVPLVDPVSQQLYRIERQKTGNGCSKTF